MRMNQSEHRLKVVAYSLVCSAVVFPVCDRFPHHPGETVLVLMPPALAAILWWGWPNVRRQSWRSLALYVVIMLGVIAVAEAFAAHVARGQLLGMEVFWAVYFIIAWRLAWALYKRTMGRVGEPLRRWGRRARRKVGGFNRIENTRQRRLSVLAMFVSPLRFCAVLFIFAPLVMGSLVHRIKIGNAKDLGYYEELPIEAVVFETDDRLCLSGWFLPDGDSDTTVVICHGSGANKGNFIGFLSVFHAEGYNALIFDARGHGDSDGHTSTFGLFETADVKAAVDWLKSNRADRARHVFGLGSSMGAMTMLRAAADDERIEAIVLDSCFVSAPYLAKQHASRLPVLGPVLANLVMASMSLHMGGSMWQIDGIDAIQRLTPRPVFLIHGQEDFVIPPDNMEKLFEAAKEPKCRWLGPGLHSNILTADFLGYQQRVLDFFSTVRE